GGLANTQILDLIPVPCYQTTPEGRILYVNEALVSLFGYPSKEMLLLAQAQDVYVDLSDRERLLGKLGEDGHVVQYQMRVRRYDGRILWVLNNARMVETENGRIILGTLEDISTFYFLIRWGRRFANQIGAPVLGLSRELKIDYVNSTLANLLGKQRDELLGVPIADVWPHWHNSVLARTVQKVLQTGQMVQRVETRLAEHHLYTDVYPIPWGLLIMAQDVTRDRQLEETLQALVVGTADAVGDAFFPSLVQSLAKALQVHCAYVGEYNKTKDQVHTLAFWQNGQLIRNMTYNMEHTPCEALKHEEVVYYPDDLPEQFPLDPWIPEIKAESYLGMPLRNTNGEMIGVMAIMDTQAMSNVLQQLPVLRIFAARAGAELERLQIEKERERLLEELKQQTEQLDVLARLGQVITANLDLEAILEVTYQCVAELMPTDAFWIASYEPGASKYRYLLKLDRGQLYPPGENDVSMGVGGYVIRRGKPTMLTRPSDLNLFEQARFGVPDPVEMVLCVPLRIGDRIIGAMSTQSYQPGAFTERDLDMLVKLAQPVAIAMENARLYEEVRRRAAELEALMQISLALRRARSSEESARVLLAVLPTAVSLRLAAIYLHDPLDDQWQARAWWPETAAVSPKSLLLDKTVLDDCRQVRLLTTPTEQRANLFLQAIGMTEAEENPVGLFPLQVDEELVGVLVVCWSSERAELDEEVRLLTAVADIAANALHRALVTETLEMHVAARTRELAEANARLQELDKLKTKFISDMTHELRTPVTGINLYLDLLARRPEKQAQYMKVLREKSRQLVQLAEDTLNIARLDMLKMKGGLHFTAVSVDELITAVLEIYQQHAQERGLTLHYSVPSSLPPVRGERNQLLQAITALVDNAVNYTTEGGITITASHNTDEHTIVLQVTDTGMGIPETELSRVFDRFYRGQAVSQLNIPGTGLGLAVVKEIVELHQGRIMLQSTPGEGTTAVLVLPCA
ncbi:MAG: PAS domain-containing protein, partial [Chloroflexi bacterium]